MSRTSPICHVLVDASELIADVVAIARALRVPVAVDADDAPLARARTAPATTPTLVVTSRAPTIAEAVALADRNLRDGARLVVSCIDRQSEVLAIVPQLGLPVTHEIGAGLAAVLFAHATSGLDASANAKGLAAADRLRLPHARERGAKLVRHDDGVIAVLANDKPHPLGRIDDVERALAALTATFRGERPSPPRVEGADRASALDVLIGPSRALSDPASKTALEPYDLPLPVEELCATASRAASESQRIGFPVRVSLASPELRPSEHPDLVVEGVESAASVREVFRELVALAERKDPRARILGVTVSASTVARCTLRLELERVGASHLVAAIGFADPHGRATDDRVRVVLPASPETVAAAVDRLRGASLLLGDSAAEAKAVRNGVTDVVLRSAAFLEDFRDEVDWLRIDPLAILVGGETEIREACVHVTDAFTRAIDAPAEARRSP